jgi:hypothetical protein
VTGPRVERVSAFAAPDEAQPPAPPPGPDLSFLQDPPRTYTREEVKLIASVAGWPAHLLDQVAEVAWCESRYNALAINGRIYGLMQVYSLWFAYGGHDVALWRDPVVNMRAALTAYQYDMAKGYEPWTQWQCRPGGRRIPASEFAPPLPEVTPSPAAEPSPSPAAPPSVAAAATPLDPSHDPQPWSPIEERQAPAPKFVDGADPYAAGATETPTASSATQTPAVPSTTPTTTPATPSPAASSTPEASPSATEATPSPVAVIP